MEQAALLTSEGSRARLARAVERAFQNLLRPGVATSNDLGVARNVGVILRREDSQNVSSREIP